MEDWRQVGGAAGDARGAGPACREISAYRSSYCVQSQSLGRERGRGLGEADATLGRTAADGKA